MRRALAVATAAAVLGVALLALTVAAPEASARSSAEARRASRVLILAAPALRWADVADLQPPALTGLLERSAVASLSTRTIGPKTTVGEGYATVGAGNRATVLDADAGLALEPSEPFEGGTAAEAFARRTGASPRGAALVLSLASVRSSNARLRYDADPGATGDALVASGRTPAVIANADTSRRRSPSSFHREAALAVMDGTGRVSDGDVSRQLLMDDPAAPFGLRLDPEAVGRAFDAAWSSADVVLVELSDLSRSQAYATFATAGARRDAHTRAVVWSDDVVRRVLAGVDLRRDAVVVMAPVGPAGRQEQLTVAAVAAPGLRPGKARGATTRRAGFVTLPDVGPTVLQMLGVEPPASMTGTRITSAGGERPGPDLFEDLAEVNDRTVFRDRATGPLSVAFVAFQVVTYGLAVLALLRRRTRMRAVVTFMALVTLATPAVAFLAALVPFHRLGVVGFVLAVFAASAVLAAAAVVAGRRRPALAPLALIGLTLGILLVDVATGGRLQINTVFGYSPVVAGRFAGFGNLAFGLVAMSAIVVGTGIWGMVHGRGAAARRRALVAVVALFLATLVADGHPRLGADGGGVLALVPAFTVVVLVLVGARLSWQRVAATAAAAVGALALFVAVDLSNPADERTHLGRLASRVLEGEGGFGTVLLRKSEANLNIVTTSIWTYIIPVAVAFLAFLTWRPPGVVRELQERYPGLRACLVGGLVAGVVGCVLNDSGVAVPAVMLAVVLPYLTVLSMHLPADR